MVNVKVSSFYVKVINFILENIYATFIKKIQLNYQIVYFIRKINVKNVQIITFNLMINSNVYIVQ